MVNKEIRAAYYLALNIIPINNDTECSMFMGNCVFSMNVSQYMCISDNEYKTLLIYEALSGKQRN